MLFEGVNEIVMKDELEKSMHSKMVSSLLFSYHLFSATDSIINIAIFNATSTSTLESGVLPMTVQRNRTMTRGCATEDFKASPVAYSTT